MQNRVLYFDEINLRALLRLVLRNLWVVALVGISAILCFTAISRLTYTPTYTSSATFMVSAKDSTSAYNSLTTTQSMASVFVEVFQSNVLREKIQEKMPDGKFSGTINTRTVPETNLLIVTVTADEPDTAFRALTLLVENYSSVSDYLFSNAQLEVIKDPVVPLAPSNPLNVKPQYPIVLVLSGALSVAGIVAIYILRDTVKTPKGARRKLDARLLRTLDHEQKNKTLRAKLRRKNSAPLITNSLMRKDFIEDNLSLCSAVEYYARKRKQKVILITSVGENEGKSTIAANLALALAQKHRKVALLDCDFRKPSLNKIFELPVQRSQCLTTFLTDEQTQLSQCLTQSKGVALGLSSTTGRGVSRLLNSGRLEQALELLRQQVDYVILDTPPMLAAADAETIAALADTAVLVVRSDFMPTDSINEGLERLRKSAPDVCGFVLNNYNTTIW